MLDYVIILLDDANDFSWSSAKASHRVLLCRIEQGEVAGWSKKLTTFVGHMPRDISLSRGHKMPRIKIKVKIFQRKWFQACITKKKFLSAKEES